MDDQNEIRKKYYDIIELQSKVNKFDKISNEKYLFLQKLNSYNIFFIGFMGVGKTSISSYLSNLLKIDKIEIDEYIEKNENMTVSEIFNKRGESYFRDCETDALKKLQGKCNKIVSCGGGIILREENIELMKKQGKVILLTASPETIYERIKYSDDRPILNNNMNVQFISKLIEERKDKYLKVADFIIDTNDKTIDMVCEEIIKKVSTVDNL